MLPGELRLDFSDGIQDSLCPALILRVHDNHAKTVIVAFDLHAFGIIDMQVYIEGWRKLRGRVREPTRRQRMGVPHAVDHAVDMDAVQQ